MTYTMNENEKSTEIGAKPEVIRTNVLIEENL